MDPWLWAGRLRGSWAILGVLSHGAKATQRWRSLGPVSKREPYDQDEDDQGPDTGEHDMSELLCDTELDDDPGQTP